jgi:dihydroorotase
MSAETLTNRIELAQKNVLVNVGFYSEFPRNVEEIKSIIENGAVAFKLFMTEQVGGLNIDDDSALVEAFAMVSRFKVLVAVHAEDRTELKRAEEELKSSNRNDIDAFLKAHSENVELKAIKRIIRIAKRTNVHVHFCHLSTENGLKAINAGKEFGMPITCEVTPHHLLLFVDDFKRIGTLALTMPPIRGKSQSAALWNGIKNRWVDILASDHAPHILEEKKARTVWNVKVGIPNLETTVPLMLTQVKKGKLSIGDVVRLMTEMPARIFGLNTRGYLREGNNADITVVDLRKKYRIDASEFLSRAKYSPFDKWAVEGKPVKTFVNGKLIMEAGEIVANAGDGSIIRGQ